MVNVAGEIEEEFRLLCYVRFERRMDDSSYRRNFDLDKKNKTITIAGKSMLK
jgi:hypothetical protein